MKLMTHIHHVIEERYLRMRAAHARAIQIDADLHLRFLRLPLYSG